MEMSQTTSRLCAIGLLLLLAALVLLYALLPLGRYYAGMVGEVALKQEQLARYRNLLANEELIDAELAQIEVAGSASDLFIAGSKPAIASANLREFIAETVRDSGGYLVSSQEYETDSPEFTTAIGLQVQVRGEVDNLVGLLHALEDSRPVTFIDELDLSSSNARVVNIRRQRRQESGGEEYSLDIQLKVAGYMLATEESEDGNAE